MMDRERLLTAPLHEVFGALRSLLALDLTHEPHARAIRELVLMSRERAAGGREPRIHEELLTYAQEVLARLPVEQRPRCRPPYPSAIACVPSLWEVEIQSLGERASLGEDLGVTFSWTLRSQHTGRGRLDRQLERHADTSNISALTLQSLSPEEPGLTRALHALNPVEFAWTGASLQDPPAALLDQPWSRLRALDLRSNPLDDEAIQGLHLERHDVHTLRLSHTRLTGQGWRVLSRRLQGLRAISMSHCALGPRGLEGPLPLGLRQVHASATGCASASGLTRLRALEELHLSDNALGDDAVLALLSSQGVAQLSTLDLGNNAWTDAGMARAIEAAALPGLRRLRLRRSGSYEETFRAIASNPTLSSLEELTVTIGAVTPTAARALATSDTLPEPLRALWRLRR